MAALCAVLPARFAKMGLEWMELPSALASKGPIRAWPETQENAQSSC
jgi:hypothetical protein